MALPIIENAVGGKRAVSASSRRTPVFNPATGEQSRSCLYPRWKRSTRR